MREKLLDKRSIFLPDAAQCKAFAAAILLTVLAGCATVHQDKAPDADAPVATEAPAEPEQRLADADPEVLFHVMAAERLISMGEYRDALDQYLQAALLAEDRELARQVTRLAAQLGEWDSALEGAQRWLELAPDSEDARQIRILGWINTGSAEDALYELLELLDRHEDEQEGWRRVTMLLGAAEDDELALEVMSRLVDHTGRDAFSSDIEYLQSMLLWQLGDAEAALDLAVKAAEGSGERKHRVWAAQLAVENEDLEKALGLYREVRAEEPDDVPLALAEAEVLRQLEREGESIALLRELRPDSDALYTLGLYLMDDGREEEAVEVWHRLAAVESPDNELHHAYLVGQLAELLELDEQALQWYARVDSGPNENRALLRRAIIKGRAEQMTEARNLLRSVRMAGDRGLTEQAWLVEAELLREADRPDEAVKLLGQALRDHPNNIRLMYARGLNAVYADDLELAEQDFRRIIQIDGDNAMALNALGYTLTDRTDRHQEAYRLIRRAYELEPDSPPILDSMGWVYFRLGEPEKALPFLEQALEGEDNPEIAAHVIEVLWTLERHDEALELRDRAIAEWPDDDYLVDTLQRLGLD